MGIVVFSPQSRAYVPKGTDGKFQSTVPRVEVNLGIVHLDGKQPTGPAILSRENSIAANTAKQ